MTQIRGIVINPGVSSLGRDGFQINTGAAIEFLRRCLLYWDRIDWPANNAIRYGDCAETELLKSAGVLQRTVVKLDGRFGGDLTPVFAESQLLVFEQLERQEPGRWSIAQPTARLQFPGHTLTERRGVEVDLYNVLPTPANTVPFEDILEFRQRYSAELLALRAALDRMYLDILSAADPQRVRAIVQGELANAVQNVERAMNGRSLASWRPSCTVEIKVPDIAKHAAGGAALASILGVPIPVGAAVGAALSTIKLSIARVPTPQPVRNGAFAYLYHAKRELSR